MLALIAQNAAKRDCRFGQNRRFARSAALKPSAIERRFARSQFERPPAWQTNEARRRRARHEFRTAADADYRAFAADQRVKRGRGARIETYAAMRRRPAEPIHLVGAM